MNTTDNEYHWVAPNVQYHEAFLVALRTWDEMPPYGHALRGEDTLEDPHVFSDWVTFLHNRELGNNLPRGHVPATTRWLFWGAEFAGAVDVRHDLDDFLAFQGGHIGYGLAPAFRGRGLGNVVLAQGLSIARDVGIDQVLITTRADNLPSLGVIKAHSGRLHMRFLNDEDQYMLRFWVSVPRVGE